MGDRRSNQFFFLLNFSPSLPPHRGTSYFALSLWVTELAPIFCLVMFFSLREGKMYWRMWSARFRGRISDWVESFELRSGYEAVN